MNNKENIKKEIINRIKGKEGYKIYIVVPKEYLISSGYEIEPEDENSKFLLFLNGYLHSSRGTFYGEDLFPYDYETFAEIAITYNNLNGEKIF